MKSGKEICTLEWSNNEQNGERNLELNKNINKNNIKNSESQLGKGESCENTDKYDFSD
ncbi:hypothetical protein KPL42_15180 [Clostridium gasigenes]|uniref:hypothetical protein n=1 Tax=Clostridium gasigenes TaxID=94869 RepID=UPI001C0E7B17|nr:hypothetical protein [Clostridium gasigenes]MBU3089827.1 hypothetical protein [Clostridium gasigenes]